MKVSTAIARIKAAGHDISDEYTNERCLEFINTALQQTSSLLIAAKYPTLVLETTLHNGDTVPQNYMQAAGYYPLRMTNNKVELIDEEDTDGVRFRYWATPEALTETDTDLPYPHDAINEVIVKAATIIALNENEYDVTTDNSILSALQEAIASAMSVTSS